MQKRFFIQIIIVLAAATFCSSLYFYSICRSLRQAKEGIPAKLDYILYDSTRYDAVFVGSSRVLRNINPLLFDSLTGLMSYNAGIDGADLTLIDVLTRKFIKSHKAPKYVLINIDSYTMEHDSSFFSFPQFMPYMDDPDLEKMKRSEPVLSLGKYQPYIAISYLNDYLKEVSFYKQFNIIRPVDSIGLRKGFAPVIDTVYYGADGEEILNFTHTIDGFAKLDSLCSYCINRGCTVFFIMAPMYRSTYATTDDNKDYFMRLNEIENKYNIREFNFYRNTGFPKGYFLNKSHLNYKGADVYTRLLANSLNTQNHVLIK